ncbi:GapR family DNA-binding domain-containing protein, partial [Klebsiella pneumoniae]
MATTSAAVQEEPATRFAKDQLRSIIERIERLEEEKKTI